METHALGKTTIRRSFLKSSGIVVGASAFVYIGVWLIQGGAVRNKGEITIFFGWLSVFFFGLCLALALQRLVFGSNSPVTLSPTGLVDKRSFKSEIPWSEIERVSVWSYRKTSLVRLQLVSGAIDRLELTWSATLTRWLNRPSGLDGLYMSSTDLDISFPELWSLLRNYVTEFCPDALDSSR